MTIFGFALISAVSLIALPSMALPLGKCADAVNTTKALAAEGQRIVATSATKDVWLTSGSGNTGYVLESDKSGSLCVVSVLASVGVERSYKASEVVNLCDKTGQFPAAATICQDLQRGWPRITKTISARATKSSTSRTMTGPVNVEFVICTDKTKGDVMCGRVETLIDRVGNR